MNIRSETTSDYARIAEIHALAFAGFIEDPLRRSFVSEFALVDAFRHGSGYEPSLSLVAEEDGVVVGHALFYPFDVYVGGTALRAVCLAPIGVHPAHQGRGVGAALMEAGHRRAEGYDCQFAFLLGHPEYYSRFGYRTNMFGACRLEFARENIPSPAHEVEYRLVAAEDIPWLVHAWKGWFGDVDLALYPGGSLLDWITHSPKVASLMVWQDGERLGYLRYPLDKPAEPNLFLPADPSRAGDLLAVLAGLDEAADRFSLPLHPDGRAVRSWTGAHYETRLRTWEAAMIKTLDSTSEEIAAYCAGVEAGTRRAGCLIYPPVVEVAG